MMSIIILTGHLDNAVIVVGSLSICVNFSGWEAMLFIGINAAISVRVSMNLDWGIQEQPDTPVMSQLLSLFSLEFCA